MLGRRVVIDSGQQVELLADLGAMIAREVELDELLATFADRVARAMAADRATLWLVDRATGELRAGVADLVRGDLRLPPGRGIAGHVAKTGEIVNLADATVDPRWAPEYDERTGYRTRSMLSVPVAGEMGPRAVVQLLNKESGGFGAADEAFARVLADQIGRALDYTSLRGDGRRRGVSVTGRFNHVIGRGAAMQAVYEMIARAAATDAVVLLHGETGTGKGLLARAIHVNSTAVAGVAPAAERSDSVLAATPRRPGGARRDGPFVHVDCTTLPAGLVESELFGHERGAYTGADARVMGKVEAAAGGTLFLDELGEIPLDLQGKLLRFVQERTFERVGGRETLSSDARIIVATNRDLAALVRAGKFRSDLYYRVRVLDIELPPLRRRGEADILEIAEHFASLYARKYGKGSVRIPDDMRPVLAAHGWPGNVRELEHAIERAVVMSTGGELDVDGLGLLDVDPPSEEEAAPEPALLPADPVTLPGGLPLAEVEKKYAQAALARAGGNRSAAARALGISRNKLARLLRE